MMYEQMRSDELAAQGRLLYGERWQTSLAGDLGISDRTVRRWMSGETAIPVGLQGALLNILEERLRAIGGMVGFSVNLADNSVFHHPTAAYFEIGENDTLKLVFGRMIPDGEEKIVEVGAYKALRQERERGQKITGSFIG